MQLWSWVLLLFNMWPTVVAFVIFRHDGHNVLMWFTCGAALVQFWSVGVYDNFRRDAMVERIPPGVVRWVHIMYVVGLLLLITAAVVWIL